MAKLASIGTGNFTTAGTWGVIDPTLFANSETSTLVCPTAYSNVARSAQATPGAITVSHIGVKLAVRTGTTGTITVHIANSSHVEVAGTAVTINTADLPVAATSDLNGGWQFFKLATPVALAAATLYEVEAKTSSANQISVFGSAATNGMSCALITTTTAAPAAGDDLYIQGEYTGTGTSNSFVVTNNNTATTDFGAASTSLVTPAVAISNKGSFKYGTTAATAYYLKVSGNLIVYSGGEFDMGTVGAEIPRDSSATLLFDCGTNVDFGLTVRNLGTFNAQGLSRSSGKNIFYCLLNTDEAANSTSLGVDTDTGWLDNDDIAVAATARTATQSEQGTLNGNAGASTLTVDGFGGTGGGLLNAHSGTSPTQAEVILLTRNVVIQGVSATLQSYIDIKATSTVDCDWVRFKWLGSNTANKRGIDIATTTSGSISIQYSSFDRWTVTGSSMPISGTAAFVISNNVAYTPTAVTQISMGVATSTTTWDISNNIIIISNASGSCITLSDVGGTCSNNRLIGASTGLQLSESNQINTISGNICHTNGGPGLYVNVVGITGTIGTHTSWRAGTYGIRIDACGELQFDSPVIFGGATCGFGQFAGMGKVVFNSPVMNGDTTFSQPYGIQIGGGATGEIVVNSGNFGTASGIKTTHSSGDIGFSAVAFCRVFLYNTILASSTEIASQTSMTPTSFIASEKHDQTAGLHKTWKKYGTITIETTTTHTGGQSIKMTPNNASSKLECSGAFGGFKVAVANGATVTPSVYVYEDGSYNGNRARLIVKKNVAMGISADTVLDTATASSDLAWEQLTGTTAAVTDDGTLEFVVDCDGTAGNLFVDSFSA